ncbi:hypothetical protein CDD82_4294 [Ophiocordyceps australis]|uniref:AB hydrolase-1 domain-containing protein n=1 Tax=Ophiocordyceps australis TaxID=1399860 RepID=A0A2C5Z1T1_9HYPO|nr:hypothetical protein CDD82_4294 [Ophiocordyceps australis]
MYLRCWWFNLGFPNPAQYCTVDEALWHRDLSVTLICQREKNIVHRLKSLPQEQQNLFLPFIQRSATAASRSRSAMDTSKLKANDARVQNASFTTRGLTYEYMIGEPQDKPPVGTVLLLHGFPDTSFGWRCQVPFLMARGLRVIVPDLLGYAGSSTPTNLEDMSLKNMSEDMKNLVHHVAGHDQQIILGGHDWGGHFAWRMALWQRQIIKCVFSICTPFFAPSPYSFEDLVRSGKLPNFGYQLQFIGPDVEREIQGETKMRQLINALYSGKGPEGEVGFSVHKGVIFKNLEKLGKTPSLTEEELDHHVAKFMLQKAPQMRGPLNWYRTGAINRGDEKEIAEKDIVFEMPTLFIAATKDLALPPHLAKNMESCMPKLTRGEVDSTHWALTEAADEVNDIIGKWLSNIVDETSKASL